MEPGTTYIDVGANIGLLSVPVLSNKSGVNVISIEASPSTLPWLLKSHLASRYTEAWRVIGTAVGAYCGETEFWSGGGATGAFDGVHNTGRGGEKAATRLPIRTLDDIWHELGEPAVSVVKMDIEGGESAAFKGARHLISNTRPVFIMEWSAANLLAYGIDTVELLALACEIHYQVIGFPQLMPVDTRPVLKAAMAFTETFLLIPIEDNQSRNFSESKVSLDRLEESTTCTPHI